MYIIYFSFFAIVAHQPSAIAPLVVLHTLRPPCSETPNGSGPQPHCIAHSPHTNTPFLHANFEIEVRLAIALMHFIEIHNFYRFLL